MKQLKIILLTTLISIMIMTPSSGSEIIILNPEKTENIEVSEPIIIEEDVEDIIIELEPESESESESESIPEPISEPISEPSSAFIENTNQSVRNSISHGYSENDIDLLARITMAEAGNQTELGKRLVIDTVLNRVDSKHFPNTVEGVIFQRGQFSPISDGRWNKCYVKPDIRQLVIEELENRTNFDVVFFRTKRYSKYGTPLFKEDDHYFSSN